MGFCALVHSQNPDLFNYNELNPHDHLENLNLAFDLAESEFGITKLLVVEDFDGRMLKSVLPYHAKSVLKYISSYYHTFSNLPRAAHNGESQGVSA
jgi:hypothetical protein